jgi:hypothetical protein
MQGLRWRCHTSAHFLDGPRFFIAGGLPEQLGRFLGTALGDERLMEGVFKACAALGLARRIAGLARFPFRSLIAGYAGLEFGISLHNGCLAFARGNCSDSRWRAAIRVVKALVSFVPHLERLIWKMLIRRGVADSGVRNRNAQVIWIQYTDGFPSWTSRVRVPSPAPCLHSHLGLSGGTPSISCMWEGNTR